MRSFGFWLVLALTVLVFAALLELNKNSVWGFIALLALAVLYVIAAAKLPEGTKWIAKFGLWLLFAALLAGVFLLSWPRTKRVPAAEGRSLSRTETVEVSQGSLRGVITADGRVEVFAGVPYAKPPVGELRWKEPQDPDKWEGVLEADHFAPMSMQPTSMPLVDSLKQIIGYHDYKISLSDNYVAPVSEDSLYLNIWRPAGEREKLPVLVFIHGGSLQTGQPWYGDYSGEGLARQGVIVVNMGYRLGVFGFMAAEEFAAESPNGTTGNYGLLDQIKALEWVRDNIAAFGGDPENVTVSGESAGAACVSALCTSPLAKGLFRRAVIESSTVASKEPPHSFRLFGEAIKSGKELMERHNCASVSELRKLSAKELVSEAYTQHHITVDGYALTETPYESYKKGVHNEEALMHGYNKEESAAFILFDRTDLKSFESKVRKTFGELADEVLALYPVSSDREAASAWAEIWGALFFDRAHYDLNVLAAENGIPVYEYTFTKKNGRLGAWHSGEMVYLYGNVPEGSRLYTERDRELSGEMTAYLLNFVKYGDPNESGLPAWPVNSASDELMEFGETTSLIKERKIALYEIMGRMKND
ncbi:MAG: carboxylesterase family protein [Clostridiales bacterium]|nr:carboxylesterase family protein [Clostridiales bacterium]